MGTAEGEGPPCVCVRPSRWCLGAANAKPYPTPPTRLQVATFERTWLGLQILIELVLRGVSLDVQDQVSRGFEYQGSRPSLTPPTPSPVRPDASPAVRRDRPATVC